MGKCTATNKLTQDKRGRGIKKKIPDRNVKIKKMKIIERKRKKNKTQR